MFSIYLEHVEVNESESFNCRCLNIFAAETSRAQLAPTRRCLRLKSKIIGELNASDHLCK